MAMAQGKTMKAIVQDAYGSADVLELRDIDKPAVGHDGVLVRVHAAGVNPGMWHAMTGRPYLMRVIGFGLRGPKVRIRGTDVAGRIEAVGKDVASLQPGDDVFGDCSGSFAEYACAREDKLVRKPANLTFEQAAAIPDSGVTALQALRDVGGVKPGQKVLIIGAAGGIGTFAVQIARRKSRECAAPRRWTLCGRSAPTMPLTTPARISPVVDSTTTSSSTRRVIVRYHISGAPSPPRELS
jgi:NADPH:quinone reductase-like Zn-dependent oxidoreductase